MPPPPPPLVDELVEEILLRLPADSPASLVRAGLVCKRWCHLVSDPGFQRRFLDFRRRAPPMLGFLAYSHRDNTTRFVPMSASGGLPPTSHYGLKPGDSRHGCVLLHTNTMEYESLRMVVWNPITGEKLKLPGPPRWDPNYWTTAVICAAAAAGSACDHLDCHRGPFVVVLVGTGIRENFVSIFSSKVGVWSKPTFAPHSGGSIQRSVRSTLLGNTLYFTLRQIGDSGLPYRNILEYNLGTRTISVVELPEAGSCGKREPFRRIEFTTMEDGRRLGFVRVEDDSRLCLWSRKVGEPGWVLCKAIRLANLLPFQNDPEPQWRYLAGSVEGVGIIFLRFKDELFTIDLRSGLINKVYPHHSSCLTIPYVNFCTPVFRAPSSLKGPVKDQE